ncbi:urease accessory protein UreD [Tepidimonas taiwanensis]|uniref:Urease accessory protein UreD n=1 Tax=Tepidimonas taiwanensis TaxID=307486 RepID=A0A554X3T7_9BURK|nr:urease accessory protein UreD [Tepidimonas taiwanensis]TSE30510.1 Urease accessory protein UreD [Tepidimonas taiwanensis]UBQ06373.1 urease accessory protein UreD [Tepidimonas taiwanensis]
MNAPSWTARLRLDFWRDAAATRLRFRHEGPLRVFKTLYPEGDAVCHTVIVHPPGGIVQGDRLDIAVDAGPDTHAVITTPGATRFYRCEHGDSRQTTQLHVGAHARLEWLPQETIVYPGVRGANRLCWTLHESASLITWDVLSLGLPASGLSYTAGRFEQTIAWPGVWLDQGCLDGSDQRLLTSPLGWGGCACLGTLVYASGSPLPTATRESWLAAIREGLPWNAEIRAAATSPDARLIVVRALAPLTEPIFRSLESTWARLRQLAWGMTAPPLRSWRV